MEDCALWRVMRLTRLCAGAAAAACLGVVIGSAPASADRLHKAERAFAAHDYATAVPLLTALAAEGNSRAETYLGYMYAHGVGVPRNLMVSAGWYRCASTQGVPQAQYELGLMYDKGQGVPQDYVIAYSLLNLAVSGAGKERERWVLMRDAIASKLSLAERTRAQQLAFTGPPTGTCLPITTGY